MSIKAKEIKFRSVIGLMLSKLVKKSSVLLVLFILNLNPMALASEECNEGMYFHPKLGRCVLKASTETTKEQARVCDNLSGDEYKKCFENNALNNMTDSGGEQITDEADKVNKGDTARYSVPLGVALVTGYYLFRAKTRKGFGPGCKSGSAWIMMGAAAGTLLTEVAAQIGYKRKLKKLIENYEQKMADNESSGSTEDHSDYSYEAATNAQALAIEFLIEKEKARKEVASIRKTGHLAVMAGYTAAVALAIYEQTQIKSMAFGKCAPTSAMFIEDPSLNFSPMIDGGLIGDEFYASNLTDDIKSLEWVYQVVLNNFFINHANAQSGMQGVWLEQQKEKDLLNSYGSKGTSKSTSAPSPTPASGTSSAPGSTPSDPSLLKESGEIVKKTGIDQKKQANIVDKALRTPYIRAALSGLLAGYSYTLHKKAKDNEKISEKRIEALEQVRGDFNETGGAGLATYCKDEDRNNPTKPNCYCYNSDGTKNQKRKGRDVCIAYMASKNLKKGKYNKLTGDTFGPIKSCIKTNGKLDDNCKLCTRSPKLCKIIPASIVNGFGVGATKLFGKAMKSLNDLSSGNLGSSNLNESNLKKKANAFKRATEKMLASPKNKDISKKFDKVKGQLEGHYDSKANRATFSNVANALNGSSALSASVSALERKISSKAKSDLPEKMKANFLKGKEVMGPGKQSNADDFDFGMDSGSSMDGGVEISDEMEAAMDKNFKFEGDIHKSSEGNIFKILSLRYQRSALIRLFDDEGKFDLDSAQNSDINSN